MSPKKRIEVAVARGPRAIDFRKAIEQAEQEGATREELVLRLTLSDSANLKRDRSVPLEDISFGGGNMRFMGVRVATGGVTVSILEAAGDEPVVDSLPVKAAKAKRKTPVKKEGAPKKAAAPRKSKKAAVAVPETAEAEA